ncbi:hypothetical protein ACIBG0_10870 [Nocardia sp. NPDC050630]|uniref:hypothetical protein n=1 Tax=Nocardia sp. NPDC050630 TaxID=3364321 RepID=UPI00379BC63E
MRDKQSTGRSEIAALAERVANARGRLPLQEDAALVQALSDDEIDAEQQLAQWVRAQRRGQRKRAVQDELAAEKRTRRTMSAIQRADDADARWHRRALAARRRVSNQDARLAQLYRRAEWSSRALIAVVVLGMVWAGVNVQHNLVPSGNMADPLYWLSYGIEAMISIPIITIMVAATTAARWGRELDRGKVVFFETALLGTTIALNAGPHLAAGSFGQAAEYAIAPVMVGVVIWLHAWVSARYALLIDSVPMVEDEPDLPPRHRVTTERGAPIDPFRDEPADRRELLAAKGFDPLLDQAGVRFPVDMDSHVAEAAMRAAQPDTVPVSRLDCTETLVYHAQSTRSTNGRFTQQIPSEDYRSGHAVRGSDSIHDTARNVADADGTRPAHPSSSAANPFGENAFHAADVDQRNTPDVTANVSQRSPHATVRVESAMAQVNTRDTHTAVAPTVSSPQTASTAADEHIATGATGFEPDTAPVTAGTRFASRTAAPGTASTSDEHTTGYEANNASRTAADHRATFASTGSAPRTAAANAASTRDGHTDIAATGFVAQNAADEHTAFIAAGFAPRAAAPNAARARDEHTTATNGNPRTAVASPGEQTARAAASFEVQTAAPSAADARDEHTTATNGNPRTAVTSPGEHTALTAEGFEDHTAAPSAVSTRDEHISVADIGTTSATTGSTRVETAGSETSGDSARTAPAAADHAAFPVTGIDLRTTTAADIGASDERTTPGTAAFEGDATTTASVRDERPTRDTSATSVVGEVESQKTSARHTAQSQLSIFDTAAVEPAVQSSDDTAHTPRGRAQPDTSRVTVSHNATTAGTGTGTGTGTEADAPRPAKSSTRAETPTRTAPAAEPQRAPRSSGTSTPAERVTRAMEGHRSRADNTASDHKDQTAESEAEGRQLLPDDAPRRTTSEVISEVVQSLSAENLLTENLGSESDDVEVWSVARAIAGRGLSVIPVEQLAEILMLADQSWTPTSIGAEVGLSRTAIAQVLEFARRVRRPYAISS